MKLNDIRHNLTQHLAVVVVVVIVIVVVVVASSLRTTHTYLKTDSGSSICAVVPKGYGGRYGWVYHCYS
jgi:heme/copper-type cytochrome/quinol oxidase subunit 2